MSERHVSVCESLEQLPFIDAHTEKNFTKSQTAREADQMWGLGFDTHALNGD